MTDTLATALLVAAGSVVTFLGQLYRESRNRRWDIEDRDRRAQQATEAARRHAREIADDLARRVAVAAAKTESAAISRTEEVLGALAANTEISVKAFDVANNVNEKIHHLGLELRKE